MLPPSWLPGFAHVDEIWVNSTFVAQNLARLSPVPVVVVPQAIAVPDTTGVEIDLIHDDRFTFVFMLDFFSTLQRKNPLGLIEAFTRAFGPDEGPRLLLKTINAEFRPQAADELRRRIGDRPDIELARPLPRACARTRRSSPAPTATSRFTAARGSGSHWPSRWRSAPRSSPRATPATWTSRHRATAIWWTSRRRVLARTARSTRPRAGGPSPISTTPLS